MKSRIGLANTSQVANMTYNRQFFEIRQQGSARSASRVVPELLRLLSPRSVADVGCGVGAWLAEFQRHGISDLLGVDGNWLDRQVLQIDPKQFVVRDLLEPLAIHRTFDLAMCLEVAEHLPDSRAEQLVGELVGLAPVVLFSAAVPFQGGEGHVNEQWPDYWARIFAKFAYFAVDCLRSRIWNDEEIEWWYRQNLILYAARAAIDSNDRLRPMASDSPDVLRLIHPDLYVRKIMLHSGIGVTFPLRLLSRVARATLRSKLGL